MEVSSNIDMAVNVSLFAKEINLASHDIDLTAHIPILVNLNPDGKTSGVLRVTVSSGGIPIAERLVFRSPRVLKVEVTTDSESYIPGASVTLIIKTSNSDGPVPAVVGLTVADDTVLELVEKRLQAPRLPAMAFLESEVDHLEDSHVYLNPKEEGNGKKLDLLLGTQGWRRFAFQNEESFYRAKDAEKLDRMFAKRRASPENAKISKAPMRVKEQAMAVVELVIRAEVPEMEEKDLMHETDADVTLVVAGMDTTVHELKQSQNRVSTRCSHKGRVGQHCYLFLNLGR